LLGVLYAALGAFTFALNNGEMRRKAVTGSVLQVMALTVPIGGFFFLVMTAAFGELGQLVAFPVAALAWLAGAARDGQYEPVLEAEAGCAGVDVRTGFPAARLLGLPFRTRRGDVLWQLATDSPLPHHSLSKGIECTIDFQRRGSNTCVTS
jgi:hypothetical protein